MFDLSKNAYRALNMLVERKNKLISFKDEEEIIDESSRKRKVSLAVGKWFCYDDLSWDFYCAFCDKWIEINPTFEGNNFDLSRDAMLYNQDNELIKHGLLHLKENKLLAFV